MANDKRRIYCKCAQRLQVYSDLGETIARYNSDGTITLTDAFSGMMSRLKELLAHEKAHGMVKHISERASSGVFGTWLIVDCSVSMIARL